MSYAAYRSVRQIRQPKGLMASLALPQELGGAHHLIVAGMAPSIVNELAALLGCDVKIVCQLVGIDRSTVTRKALRRPCCPAPRVPVSIHLLV